MRAQPAAVNATSKPQEMPAVEMRGEKIFREKFDEFQRKLKAICKEYLYPKADGSIATNALNLTAAGQKSVQALFNLSLSLDKADFKTQVLEKGLYFSQVSAEVRKLLPEISKNKSIEKFCMALMDCLFNLGDFTSAQAGLSIKAMHALDSKSKKDSQNLMGILDENERLDKEVADLNETNRVLNDTIGDLQGELERSRAMSSSQNQSFWAARPADTSVLNAARLGRAVPANGAKKPSLSDSDKLKNSINRFRLNLIREVLLPFRREQNRLHETKLKIFGLQPDTETSFLKNVKAADELIRKIVPHYLTGVSLGEIISSFTPVGDCQEVLHMQLLSWAKKENFKEEADKIAPNISSSISTLTSKGRSQRYAQVQVKMELAATMFQIFNSPKEDRVFEPDAVFAETFKKPYGTFKEMLKQLEAQPKAESEKPVEAGAPPQQQQETENDKQRSGLNM